MCWSRRAATKVHVRLVELDYLEWRVGVLRRPVSLMLTSAVSLTRIADAAPIYHRCLPLQPCNVDVWLSLAQCFEHMQVGRPGLCE
jgi:hypothetical protein